MPNLEVLDDSVVTIPILTQDAGGATVPPPAGDTFSAASSSASLGVAIVTTPALALVLTPLVQASPGIIVTVSDKNGLAVATQVVDIVQDLTPTNIVLDTAAASGTLQPVPTAPGP